MIVARKLFIQREVLLDDLSTEEVSRRDLGVVVAKFATTTADGELKQESNLHILQKCSSAT